MCCWYALYRTCHEIELPSCWIWLSGFEEYSIKWGIFVPWFNTWNIFLSLSLSLSLSPLYWSCVFCLGLFTSFSHGAHLAHTEHNTSSNITTANREKSAWKQTSALRAVTPACARTHTNAHAHTLTHTHACTHTHIHIHTHSNTLKGWGRDESRGESVREVMRGSSCCSGDVQ